MLSDRSPSAQELTRRNWQRFRTAAEWIASSFAARSEVQKVALFGSVAAPVKPRHHYQDVDLAVWLWDLRDLRSLDRLLAETLNRLFKAAGLGVAAHQVDVFLFQPGTERYLGGLCHFKTCPKWKDECAAPACGDTEFLRQHKDFRFRSESLRRAMVLFERPVTDRAFVEPGRENTLDLSWEEAAARFEISPERVQLGRDLGSGVRPFLVYAKSIDRARAPDRQPPLPSS